MVLKTEIETFRRKLPELLDDNANQDRYVLIKGDEIIGIFTEEEDALKAGYIKFEDDPFLVRQINRESEEPQYFARGVRWDS